MALTDYLVRKPEFDLFPMRATDLVAAAALHKQRFTPPWSEGDLRAMLAQPLVFGFVARQTNALMRTGLGGFVLSRVVSDEAEILTVAVSSASARLGLGWRLMQAAAREAHRRDAECLFLEVDETNLAAVGLYRKLGFQTVGQRRAYYQGADGKRNTALVMRLDFPQADRS